MIYQNYSIGGELCHHGVLHQKWGVRNGPPYPLSPDVSTGKKLKDKPGKGLGTAIRNARIKKKHKEALEKARQTRSENIEKKKTAEEREAEKERALKSGSAGDIMKFQGELTNQQLLDALTRLEREGKLSQMAAADKKSAADKIDQIINNIDRVRGWTDKGINAYNTAAKIANALGDADLPIIGANKPSKKDEKSKDFDLMLKQLQVENQKLKNENQEIQNKGEILKNKQTETNQKNQKKKNKKK